MVTGRRDGQHNRTRPTSTKPVNGGRDQKKVMARRTPPSCPACSGCSPDGAYKNQWADISVFRQQRDRIAESQHIPWRCMSMSATVLSARSAPSNRRQRRRETENGSWLPSAAILAVQIVLEDLIAQERCQTLGFPGIGVNRIPAGAVLLTAESRNWGAPTLTVAQ